MAKILRKHYWNPVLHKIDYVNEEKIVHTFNEHQESGTWNGLHSHDNCGELMTITKGLMVAYSEEKSFYAQEDRAVWIPSGLIHEWHMPVNTANRSLFIHNSVVKDVKGLQAMHVIKVTPLLREIVIALDDIEDFSEEMNRRLALVLVDRIATARACVDNIIPMPRNKALLELATQILTEPATPVHLSDWSDRLQISEKTLTRIFIRETGLNFRTWYNILKMKTALNELESGKNVTEVAFNCGYNSISAFIASFKKYYGETPSQIMKNK